MQVRNVAWTDFTGIAALRMGRYDAIANDPNYGMVSNPSKPTEAELAAWFGELQRGILEGKRVCSVAVEDGHIVGMAGVTPEGRSVETRHVGVLGIEVLAGYHGRGIGSALLAHVLEACRGRFDSVDLAVIPENPRAEKLYRKFGFVEYGRRPRAFQRGGTYHDFILMRKAIAP